MLRTVSELLGHKVLALDGDIGQVDDVYFDDKAWTIRYLVVDIGTWLSDRKVLIAPIALGQPDWEAHTFPVTLTKAQIERSPDLNTNKPISRQQELELHQHYDWPAYWAEGGILGRRAVQMSPELAAETQQKAESEEQSRAELITGPEGDPHLRSSKEVTGYNIEARDGAVGHVEDFIVDDGTWAINYMIVDTRNWLPGKKVVIAPEWVEMVNWAEGQLQVDLSRETIKNSPKYDPAELANM